MKIHWITSSICSALFVLWSQGCLAAEEVRGIESSGRQALEMSLPATYNFVNELPTGFYRKKLSSDFRIRGWEISDSLYLGQAKVGDKWGLGMVFQNGNTAYGINHRGIQVMKSF